MKTEYKKPQISAFIQTIVNAYGLDYGHVKATLTVNHPELFKKECCANCGASMEMTVYNADVFSAILLKKVAEAVRENIRKGVPFTEANMIHVPTLATTDAIRHRTTICKYLNYLQQPPSKKNSGYWLVTNWGWKALRGEAVPCEVKVFRGELVSREDDNGKRKTTTLGDLFSGYNERMATALERRDAVQEDYRADVRDYNKIEWAQFSNDFATPNLI